ncbi:MAG: hypothetical protein RSD64_00700 [Christensenellaceae bacterium]
MNDLYHAKGNYEKALKTAYFAFWLSKKGIDAAFIFKVTVSLSVKHIRFERYGFQKEFVSGALVRVWYAYAIKKGICCYKSAVVLRCTQANNNHQ